MAIALADLIIEAAPIVVVIAASVEIGKNEDLMEAARRRRPNRNLSRCLDAAAAGGALWENFCNTIPNDIDRATCWSKTKLSEQDRRGWCNEKFGYW
ncbi:hypothetical protein [Polyangium fumosum]|uniref:Uncharacterized protein n=1 Tax=Polyangium fumosum TaxID=889272 RepID=A0A4U1IWX9_9BACT|nr:hypothetical protein [Polyangium fumosum]TKC98533.1 hypothetical protein E8A74_40970 [Polyangium fumosum]